MEMSLDPLEMLKTILPEKIEVRLFIKTLSKKNKKPYLIIAIELPFGDEDVESSD